MVPSDNSDSGKSENDSFQPKTPAMKAWKKKYLSDEESENNSNTEDNQNEGISTPLEASEEIKPFWLGFWHPLKLFLPLSIISYFNEVKNGYFCFEGFDCASPPSYYPLPKVIALFSIIFFLFVAIVGVQESDDSGNNGGGYGAGIVTGIVVGVMIFIILTAAGWAS